MSLVLGACSNPGTSSSERILPSSAGGTPNVAAPNAGGTPSVDAPNMEGVPPIEGGVQSPDVSPASADAGSANVGTPTVDGGTSNAADAAAPFVPGSLDVSWMHGAANCAQSTDPELQVHAYDATTYVFRQNKCRTFEAPFVYLLLGTDRALLLDTGATTSAALRDAVVPLVGARALIVAHTHAHGDHVASDARFRGQPGTTVVGTSVAAVQGAFGIDPWPSAAAELDLGGRVLDVLAIPGHEQSHIALYDRTTRLLLTGDTLYPGLLFITDWAVYRQSIRRLAEFVASHSVLHVLGAHVEMTATPTVVYPYGTTYQPDEHVLELGAEHVLELDAALTALGASPPPGPVAHDDFVIAPQ